VGRIDRGVLQGEPHHSLNLRITDLTRRPWPRLIEQTIQTTLQKALPPFADGLWANSELARNQQVGIASRALNTIRARWTNASLVGRRAQFSRLSRSSIARLKGAIGLPVRIRVLPPYRRRLRDCNYSTD
jgi:hypothetical protein